MLALFDKSRVGRLRMCGIALSSDPEETKAMLNRIKHRGPDGSGIVTALGYTLGHVRLAIVGVDDPEAVQPYVRGDSITAFNGEIFNCQDLLPGSEVQLLSYLIRKGEDLGMLINGYYAAVLVDISRQEIVLVRDLFGVMPLYYKLQHGKLSVASERKAWTDSSGIKPVPPNSVLKFNLRTKKMSRKSMSYPFFLRPSTSNLTEEFLNAVKRTASHSEVGFSLALSGGLDSSLILMALVKLNLVPKEILTTVSQTQDTSEVDRACSLIRHLGLGSIHRVIPLETTDISLLDSPPNPIRDFAFQRHCTIAKHCKTKVLLCGEGADELDLGYPVKDIYLPYKRFLKRISLLKSQASMTLDRVNLAGMLFSKEYRVPFLDIPFVQAMLTSAKPGKSMLRLLGQQLGLPPEIAYCEKYSQEEFLGRSQNLRGS